MERHNSYVRNRAFNRVLDVGTNGMIDLNVPYVPDNDDQITSRTISDLVGNDRNVCIVPSESRSENHRSIDIHGISVENSQLYSPNSYPLRQRSPSPIRRITNSSSFGDTPSVSYLYREDNVGSSIQMQNLWHASTSSSSRSEQYFPGAIGLDEIIRPSGGPVRHLRANGAEDAIRSAANLSMNNIGPLPFPFVDNRERLLSEANSVREPGHRDNPIVIEDDEEDIHDDAQQGDIFAVVNLFNEGSLAPQGRTDDIRAGLRKRVISKLLRHRKYQSANTNNDNNSCCICLDTYSDGDELGKVDCGHEFHFHCIGKWLRNKNFCPLCKRTALRLR